MNLFLSLPVECIVHLSNWLDFEDYLSLRGTTKAVSRLILPSTHALQEDIAAKIPQLLPRNTPLSDQSAYNIIRARPSRIFHLNSLDLKLTQIACSTLLLRGRSLDWITDQVQQASVNLKATFKTCVSLGFFSQYSEKIHEIQEMISRGGDDLLDQALEKTRFYPIYSVKRLRERLIEHYCIKYILQEYNLSSTNRIQYTYTVQEMTYLQTLHPGLPIALLRNARQYSVVQLLKGSTQEIENFLRKNPYAIRYLGARTDIHPMLAKSLLKHHPLSIFSWPKIALLEHQAKDAVRLPQVQEAYKNPLAFLQAMKYDPHIALKYPDLKNSPTLLKALFHHNPKLAVQNKLCSEQDPRWLLLNNSPDELNQE